MDLPAISFDTFRFVVDLSRVIDFDCSAESPIDLIIMDTGRLVDAYLPGSTTVVSESAPILVMIEGGPRHGEYAFASRAGIEALT